MAISSETRQAVSDRAAGKCEYCKSPESYSIATFSIEHILPKVKDGNDNFDNLAFSCQQCNNHKYTAVEHPDPVNGRVVPLFNPRIESWAQHFAWDVSCTKIVGMSGPGRATVDRLKLNRDGVVNLRRLLFEKNLHP